MCLTSRPQENKSTIAVMSSGDSNMLSGTPSASSPLQSSVNMNKSDSSERFRGDVASLDAVSIESEVSEAKKEQAKSAFEITSVEPAPADDDLDTTGRAQPTSMDDSSLRLKIEEESEEDNVSIQEEQHTPTGPGDIEGEPSSLFGGGLSSSSAVELTRTQQTSSSGNGPSVQPGGGRFRKVNKYTRGRWTVRDMETTEERSGTEVARHTSQGSQSKTNVFEPGSGSPSTWRRAEQQESLHSRSGSELGQAASTSMAVAPLDNTSDKDIHLDRSSTAADTLSRNTSLSSIDPPNAPDERSTDVELDSHMVPSGAELAEAAIPTSYPAPHMTTHTSTSETAGMTSTAQVREHPVSQLNNGPLEPPTSERQPSKSEGNPVKEAMAHLQRQLDVLLTSKTGMEQKNTQLHEQIISLSGEVSTLREENLRLKQIIEGTSSGQHTGVLEEKNRLLQEENTKLKNELQGLRSALSSLVHKGSDDSLQSQGSSTHT